MRGAIIPLVMLGALAPPCAHAQSLFERLNLDRLRLTALGVTAGPVRASRAEHAQSYGVFADYGYIARSWRIVFSATYWGSRFRDDFVNTFEQRLRDRKSTRLNSSRSQISYAVFCLKKKKNINHICVDGVSPTLLLDEVSRECTYGPGMDPAAHPAGCVLAAARAGADPAAHDAARSC